MDVPNCEQRRIMTNHLTNLNENAIPDSELACLCSNPSGVTDSNYQYGHESGCYIASKGYVKVGRHLAEHRRMRRSLNLAKEVQQNLLPKQRPDYKGLDIAGKSIYCDETGGDYFDYHDIGKGAHEKLGVAIGDVSGKGVPASLFMAVAKTLLKSTALNGIDYLEVQDQGLDDAQLRFGRFFLVKRLEDRLQLILEIIAQGIMKLL